MTPVLCRLQEVLSKGASEWAVKLIDDLSPKRRKMLCDVARILFGRPQEYAMAFWQAKYGASDADLAGLQQSGLLSVQGGLLFLHDEDKKCILEHKGCQEVLAVADHFLFFLEESDANWQLFVKLLRAGQYTVTGIYLGIITVAAGGAALAGGGVVGVLAGGVAVAYLGNVYHTMFKATRKGLQFATEKCTTLVRDLYLTSALKKQVKLGTTVWVRLEPFAVVVDVKNLVGLAGRLRVLEIVTAEVKNADMVGEFVRLEHLSLRAANLLHVPITIKALVNLKTLRLAGNRGLLGLPSLRVLRQLELLDLTGCMSLGAIVPDVPSTCKVLYP